jgi:putative ABC transport system substrate-binding protein
MITRRRLIVALVAGMLPVPPASAQPASRVHRIGVLLNSAAGRVTEYEMFLEALRNAGYVEGRNLLLIVRGTERFEELPRLAAELITGKPDLVVTYGTPPLAAMKEATETIPIVGVAIGGDPEKYVASLARPGGNITGVTTINVDLAQKRLDVLKQAAPKVSRIAVLWNPLNPAHPVQLQALQTTAAALVLTVRPVELRRFDDFQGAVETMIRERIDAVIPLPDGVSSSHRRALTEFALARRIPFMGVSLEWPRNGALLSYGPDYRELWRRGAMLVDRILKGARPAELPIEQPTTYQLVINLKIAKALGLKISRDLLVRADEVIE